MMPCVEHDDEMAAPDGLPLRRLCSERSAIGGMRYRAVHSHHQPPDSKSGAPLIELQGWKWSRLPVLPRSDLVYKTSAWLLCQAGGKWRKPEVMLPILRSRTIRFRGGPGALVRFNFHVGIGESPRCCPVLRGLRMRERERPPPKTRSAHCMDAGASNRCIAAMLATQSGSQQTCSTSRKCSSVRLPTGGGALVRFDFQKSGCPGWIAAPAAAQMALSRHAFAPSTSRVRAGRCRC